MFCRGQGDCPKVPVPAAIIIAGCKNASLRSYRRVRASQSRLLNDATAGEDHIRCRACDRLRGLSSGQMFGIDDSACQRLQVCYIDLRLGMWYSDSGVAVCYPALFSSATEHRPRALLRTCLRHANDGANSRSLSPSSNQKGVGRGAHAADRHERRQSIGYLRTLVLHLSCWCISSGKGPELRPLHLHPNLPRAGRAHPAHIRPMQRKLPHRIAC
jgi:hypothetical protein